MKNHVCTRLALCLIAPAVLLAQQYNTPTNPWARHVVPYAANIQFPLLAGTVLHVTLTGNATSSVANIGSVDGKLVSFLICQDIAGGHAFTWPAVSSGGAAIAPAASACTEQTFIVAGPKLIAVAGGGSGCVPGGASGDLQQNSAGGCAASIVHQSTAAELVGHEYISNGNFAGGLAGWTVEGDGTGWEIVAGHLHHIPGSNTNKISIAIALPPVTGSDVSGVAFSWQIYQLTLAISHKSGTSDVLAMLGVDGASDSVTLTDSYTIANPDLTGAPTESHILRALQGRDISVFELLPLNASVDITIYGVSLKRAMGDVEVRTPDGAHIGVVANSNENLGVGEGALNRGTALNHRRTTAFGFGALASAVNSWDNTAIGAYAMSNANRRSFWFGQNTAIGAKTLLGVWGNYNTAVGFEAGGSLGDGSHNSYFGSGAKPDGITGSYRTVIGSDAIGTTDNSVTLGRAADTVKIPGALEVAGAAVPTAAAVALKAPIASPTFTGNVTIPIPLPEGGTSPQTANGKLSERISVKDRGAKGDGVTNDYAAIQAVLNLIPTHPGIVIFFPSGTYNVGTGLTITRGHFRLFAEDSATTIQYTGTAALDSVLLITSGDPVNFPVVDARIEGLRIAGNVHAVNSIKMQGVHHSTLRQLRLGNVTGAGLVVEFGIINVYDSVHVSIVVEGGVWAVTPTNGYIFDHYAGLGEGAQITSSTIISPDVEGVSGDGIVIRHGNTTSWNGGTSENNGGYGLKIEIGGANMTFNGLDLEGNTAGAALVLGVRNRFVGMYSGGTFTFGNAAQGNRIVDSGIIACTFLAGSVDNVLENVNGDVVILNAGTLNKVVNQNVHTTTEGDINFELKSTNGTYASSNLFLTGSKQWRFRSDGSGQFTFYNITDSKAALTFDANGNPLFPQRTGGAGTCVIAYFDQYGVLKRGDSTTCH